MSRKIISILFGFLFLVLLSAQRPMGHFNITGNVKVDHGLVEGTNIQILRNGALLSNVAVNRTGNFRLQVELGHVYMFTFSKQGYYPKSIEVDTRLPDGTCTDNCVFPPYQISLLLYRMVPGVHQLEQDLPRISYNPQIDNFDADVLRDERSLKDELPRIMDEIKKKSERYERETLKAKNDQYNSIVSEAGRLYNRGSYEAAMHKYRDALLIFPSRTEPRQQVNRMYQLMLHNELTETFGPHNESNILKYINYGEAKMREREYTVAKVALEIASRIKPGDNEILTRLNTATAEVNNLHELGIAEVQHYHQVYNARIQRYNELVEKGEREFLREELAAAKEHFALAVPQISESSYALLMTEKIDEVMFDDEVSLRLAREREEAERRRLLEARNRAYDDAIAEADRNFNLRRYRDAIEFYELALSIKEFELYPRNQIRIINSILARLQIEGEEYNNLIRQADALMHERKYRDARPLYVDANRLIPNEQYAKGKIEEIDRLLAFEDKEQEIREKYNETIRIADAHFENRRYDEAITAYQQASEIIRTEKYPIDQITKIRGILSRESDTQQRQQQQKADYDRTIAMADRAFNQKSYQSARSLYQQALQIIPGQDYPANQIRIIDQILRELAERQREPVKLEQIDFSNLQNLSQEVRLAAYNEAMALGESFVNSREWGLARFYFRRALALVPADEKATQRLNFVESEILGDNVNESKYNEMIQRADEAFNTGDFGVARFYYLQAREAKPNDEYVNERLQVTTRLAETTASRTANREYDEAMNRAAEALEANNLSVARFFYRRALSLKPNDPLAKEKIDEVDKRIRQQ